MNSQKDKGKRYERKIAKFYRSLGHDVKRGIQSRDGNEVPDVIVKGKAWWIECKHYASGGLVHRAYEQAFFDSGDDDLIIVHTHEDEGMHLVTVALNDFEKLMLQAQCRRHFDNFL